MEAGGASALVESPVCAVTLATGGPAGPAKTFTLRLGDVLRVGRGAANDFVLALGGVSTCHAELFLRQSDAPGESGADLFVRDTSKNGTGVQRISGSVAATWQALPRGGLLRLESGWRLLLPLKGLPTADELAHTMTVTIAHLEGSKSEAEAEATGAVIKNKTPARKPREKTTKADAGRKRKQEEDSIPKRSRRREANAKDGSERQPGALQIVASPVSPMVEASPVSPKVVSEERHRKHRKHRRHEGDPERKEKKEKRRRRRGEEGHR